MANEFTQTSVRLSPAAYRALEAFRVARGTSRDAAVRELLDGYVSRQSLRNEDERLTHISTALRFPPTPLRRGDQDGRVRVPFRADPDTVSRAAALALRLPGQPWRRGHGHYSPRPLTDALTVAISSARSFTDDGLEGLPALVTHGAALGLWRLTVAATLSAAERRVLLTAPDSELATILTDEDVCWHAPWRFEVALHIARKLLLGTGASANLQMLSEQRGDFAAALHDYARTDWQDSPVLHDCPAVARQTFEGRGGAAVWRAQRKLTMTRLAQWAVHRGVRGHFETLQPAWLLRAAPGWRAVPVAHNQPLTPAQRADVNAVRVIRIHAGSRSTLWPYAPDGAPVPGFAAVAAAGHALAPESIVELVLLTSDELGDPWVPADLACAWGFIDPHARDRLIGEAATNRRRAVENAHQHHLRDVVKLEAVLRKHVDDPERFARVARQQGLPGGPFRGAHRWPIGSVADVLSTGAPDEQVGWLVETLTTMRTRVLEGSMQNASMKAYWYGQPHPDDIV
jgi:hypothetical protein